MKVTDAAGTALAWEMENCGRVDEKDPNTSTPPTAPKSEVRERPMSGDEADIRRVVGGLDQELL